MSIECGECEQDLRGERDPGCSHFVAEDDLDESVGCLHGVPWCEECALCNEEEDEADFV